MHDPETIELVRDGRRSQASPRTTAPGTGEVLGSYRILGVLGEGAVGRVFLAEHIHLGRKVALKMLREEHASNPTVVQRFFGEARAVNQISHENIVTITDFVEGQSASYYIMELLEGETLSRALARGRLTNDRILSIASQIASALEAVHAQGIVHRDLKPANIFLTDPDRRVKLLDFGVAKLTEQIAGMHAVETAAGVIVGTASYMSPEQASAMPVDHRTDIYALGVILYEMLTGINPFEAPTFLESLLAQQKVTPQPPSLAADQVAPIPPSLDALVMACLAKNPADRPQSMGEVKRRLDEIRAESDGEIDRLPKRAKRRGPAIAIGSLAVGALAFGALWLERDEPKAEPIAPAPPREGALAVAETPPVPPPAPREITLAIDSRPRNARVTLIDPGGARRSIGNTPLTHRMLPSKEEHQLQFELPNHRRSIQTIVPAMDVQIIIPLERDLPRKKRVRPVAKRPLPPAPKQAEPIDRDGVLNPFD